jgi:hypothetical protein
MWILNPEDRMRVGSLLAARARNKARDAEIASEKGRHPGLVEALRRDATWSRDMAAVFLSREEFRG